MAKKPEEKEMEMEKSERLPVETPPTDAIEYSVQQKLVALYKLQQIYSQIDKIRIIRGELPLEVRDLEDACAGLETRVANYGAEIKELEQSVLAKNELIKDAKVHIKRYQEQQNNVRNNREYETLAKEIDYQNLEIQSAEKQISKFNHEIVIKNQDIDIASESLQDLKKELSQKKEELNSIIAETEKEEHELLAQVTVQKSQVEERLVMALERIRKNARNGLAVVKIEREACGGCFNKIPPQRQLDIRMHKKIIVCESCGRILIDSQLVDSLSE